ncbi:N-acetylmuramoyl-L-alanine amidase [Ornithinibacillus halophilus]|uniref:N-acetylmuramoyl-L-alanine amidase n=1 Tax=Ornithinibacillus halophilus TaxID=930117 RepID=A0A1M5G969_9BACI|nr:N-acetylmuramoyl-L-alanine amidase [Ornithinibacillus halophilus]SHG00256.1 N-acetylmuramoyl-L-alanine amidase [Ornithinibacillus halophilus]
MKVLPSVSVILCFFLLFEFSLVFAEEKKGQVYIVNTPILNMREDPSIESDVLGRLVQGNFLQVLQHKANWSKVNFDGKEAWVASDFIIPAKEEEQDSFFITPELLDGYTIVIDPGHGGKDPGAIGINGVHEKDLILSTSKKIAKQLRENGAKVVLTRTDDYFVSLDERINIAHAHNADAFISIHYNAFSIENVQGFNTYYFSSATNRNLAKAIHGSLAEEVNLHNRGLLEDDYRVLRKNQRPSVLIELGFITNSVELKTLQSDGYQSLVAKAIAKGLMDFFHGRDEDET